MEVRSLMTYGGGSWVALDREGAQENLLGASSLLYLALNGSYMGIYYTYAKVMWLHPEDFFTCILYPIPQ